MIRYGLCCIFRKEPIRFRRTTATYLKKYSRSTQVQYLADLCFHNARELFRALEFCTAQGIGSFRIMSQILPLKTHPDLGYDIHELPGYKKIIAEFKHCGTLCRQHDLRTTFHPDQFVVLSSPSPDVTRRSVAELTYQAEVAAWVGADVITLHAGGVYGDKNAALRRLSHTLERLPQGVITRLALENDDCCYAPKDLLPLCKDFGIPLVYDVHHHRCLPDGMSVEAATEQACATWNREPVVHLSSPLHRTRLGIKKLHHDYINPRDFPSCWRGMSITIEVEAKAKELAVLRLMRAIEKNDNGVRR